MPELRTCRPYRLPDIVSSVALAQCRQDEIALEASHIASAPAAARRMVRPRWLIRPWRLWLVS